MRVTALTVYPLKGARGVPVAASAVEPRGLRGDRRWMLADADGRFLSQRTHPRLALMRATLLAAGLRLDAPGMPPLEVPVPPPDAPRRRVQLWSSVLEAPLAETGGAWLREALGTDAQLVYMDESLRRPVDPDFAVGDALVSFADGYPLLLTTTASLADLNARLDAPVSMQRFRPNVVIEGAAPFEEDGWGRIRVGEVELHVVKPCARCAVPAVDPETGAVGKEPLKTLATYRRWAGKVYFGQNVIPAGEGRMHVGDRVEVL
ncbi:MAG: MOSC domain-containing protein, partial [Rhodothermales bacterium]|nr:MOSC domain-containing protein [Rhodothermales bacterium]